MQSRIGAILVAMVVTGCGRETTPVSVDASQQRQAAHPERQLIEDLVLANRILASDEVDVLDTGGHVSVRSRRNPERFYISRYVAPGIVTVSDIIENDLDSKPVAGAHRCIASRRHRPRLWHA